MNIEVTDRRRLVRAQSRMAVADCDIHPRPSDDDILGCLDPEWRDHLKTFGSRQRNGFGSAPAYPKSQPNACRRDAWPPDGGRPGSNLKFLQTQLLDGYNIEFGLLNPVGDVGQCSHNQDLGAALARSINRWQRQGWLAEEKRLHGSIAIACENAPASVAEIEHWAGDGRFVQIIMQSRSAEPLGQQRYWPIYEAAAAANLPIGVHAFGFGGNPATGGGWPSYYIEDMIAHAQACMSLLTSMVFEGVFERFPKTRLVLIESGFGWLPSLAWRLDKIFKRQRSEMLHLKRLPSEYIREHVWVTSQPMEEPEKREQVKDVIDWIGWDRLMFATDYPHWDFDDPAHALPIKISDVQRRQFFRDNAMKLYRRA